MDFMFLIQIILAIVFVVCFVGWIIASWVEQDLIAGEWRGDFMVGCLLSALAEIVITLIQYGGIQ